MQNMSFQNNKCLEPIKNWIYSGIFFICILGTFMHFLYELTGESIIVALFAPVNESIWEHMKLAFLPTLIWWGISYSKLSKKCDIDLRYWLVSCVISFVACNIFILSFFYIYTGAFGIHSSILDIFSYFFGVIFGQIFAFHILRYANFKPWHFYFALITLLIITSMFIIFTFSPPHLPIFKDNLTGEYGI